MTPTLKQISDVNLNLPQVAPSLGFLSFLGTWETLKVSITWIQLLENEGSEADGPQIHMSKMIPQTPQAGSSLTETVPFHQDQLPQFSTPWPPFKRNFYPLMIPINQITSLFHYDFCFVLHLSLQLWGEFCGMTCQLTCSKMWQILGWEGEFWFWIVKLGQSIIALSPRML